LNNGAIGALFAAQKNTGTANASIGFPSDSDPIFNLGVTSGLVATTVNWTFTHTIFPLT
jgi:hypothetical protein